MFILNYILLIISAFGFGSNYVPIKKYSSGDGMFFQFIFCCSIFVSGIIVAIYTNCQFYPLAMLGGFLWTTGNILCVPAIKLIGLAPAVCIWGSANMLVGWSSGVFGIFGYPIIDVISNKYLNYIGVFLSLLSLIFYSLLKIKNDNNVLEVEDKFLPQVKENIRRLIGIGCALVSGTFFGVNFNPIVTIRIQEEISNLDCVFSHFCGIFLTSFIYFLIYCVYKQTPLLYPKIIVPAFLSGMLWSLADIAWFISNEKLGQSISFPIVTSTPNIVASLWSVFVFKEIIGKKNYLILSSALILTILSNVSICLSK